MRLLDKIVQAVLLGCMIMLGGYIILRGVTIAGENGLFQNTPLLSAVYRKIEDWTTGTVMPVFSYVQREEEQEENPVEAVMEDMFPLEGFARRQGERDIESRSEYQLIVQAEAQAEENKQPRDIQEMTEEKKTVSDERLYDYNYLLNNYFSMDITTTIDSQRLDGEKLLAMDMRMEKKEGVPQILIYHTHSQETFVDSIPGDAATSIVGVGEYLAEVLEKQYGYGVIHETGVFDLVDGVLDRNMAYDLSEKAVTAILEENPSIEIVIDLHRDGVDGTKFVTEYQGEPAAKLMMIVGMSRTADNMDITYLPNPYVEDNLAFALQLQLEAEKWQPELMRNIYLMAYRFNMHLRPKSLLLEAGTQLNTLGEEKKAMEAFASLLDKVLQGTG